MNFAPFSSSSPLHDFYFGGSASLAFQDLTEQVQQGVSSGDNTMTCTDNGAPSHSTTNDARVNLFFKCVRNICRFDDLCGSKRQQPDSDSESQSDSDSDFEYQEKNCATATDKLYKLIDASWDVDKLDTMKILMNWRDCRGGKGDYGPFLVAIAYLAQKDPAWVLANLQVIPEYGRWLDLVMLWHCAPSIRDDIMDIVVNRLETDIKLLEEGQSGISLLAKWLPSEKGRWDRVNDDSFYIALCKKLFQATKPDSVHKAMLRQNYLSPLRKFLKLVETKMCDNMFPNIDYETVPSVAMNKYKKAFKRHDKERYAEYLAKVLEGKAKINASQMYPHDIVRQYMSSCLYNEDETIEAQWQEIKKNVQSKASFKNCISVVDVSGSMSGTPMQVAIALGLLTLNEANKNTVITFSERPNFHQIPDGSLYQQVHSMKGMNWGANTNFEKVMDMVFGMIIGGADIRRLYIFSDMQFDYAMTMSSKTHFQRIKYMFTEVGKAMPEIVFWNLSGSTHDFPVTCNEHGVIMLSGYSPSLLTSLIDGDDITPLTMMLKIIHSDRYKMVVAP